MRQDGAPETRVRQGGEMEERIIAADPVADPQGYRRELLALLGDDDPAQVLAATLAAFQERTSGLHDELIIRRPEPGEWSVAELLGHLWDAELAYALRRAAGQLRRPAQRQPRPHPRHPGGPVGAGRDP
jgi:hypothetical protein